MNIVAKFGGTSMATQESISQVVERISALPDCRVVVVSAPGRSFDGDPKVTDLLLRGEMRAVQERFKTLAERCGVSLDLSKLSSLSSEADKALLASRGEYYSSQLLAAILGSEWTWVDAASVMRFRDDGSFYEGISYELICQAAEGRKIVIGGFYGATESGRVITFDRGGSDITGSHCAVATRALEYHNYTDVEGVFSEDPRSNANATHFAKICAQAFINMRACVVHAEAVRVASAGGIPVRVGSTFNSGGRSTLITPCAAHCVEE